MDHDESLLIRRGRCGREVRVLFKELLGLWTFDCWRCRLPEGEQPLHSYHPPTTVTLEGEAEVDAKLADIAQRFSADDVSILVLMAVGFSDRELNEHYSTSPRDLADLLARLADRLRSLQSRPDHPGK